MRWGPSVHRFGHRFDHGMVEGAFQFRVSRHRAAVGRIRTNWEALQVPSVQQQFEELYVRNRVDAAAGKTPPDSWEELSRPECEQAAAELHTVMQAAVEAAKAAIPARERDTAVRRWPRSKRTRDLFDERERALQRAEPGSGEWREAKAKFRNSIAHACRRDRRRGLPQEI